MLPLDPCFYFFEVVELLDCLHVKVVRDYFLRLEIALDCTEVYAVVEIRELGALDVAGQVTVAKV